MRIGPGGTFARATSHHGYSYGSAARLGRTAELTISRRLDEPRAARPLNGWGLDERLLRISGGSHAGHAAASRTDQRARDGGLRPDPAGVAARIASAYAFAISPPWRKRVYFDPEYAEDRASAAASAARRRAGSSRRSASCSRRSGRRAGRTPRAARGATGRGCRRRAPRAPPPAARRAAACRTGPGRSCMTRTPRPAMSRAAGSVRPTMPPFEAA